MEDHETSYTGLRNTLLMIMILLPFIPFILILGIGYTHFTRSLQNGTVAAMERIVEDHSIMIDSFLKERRADLAYVADSRRFSDLRNIDELKAVFGRLLKKSPAFADLGVFDPNGMHAAYYGPHELTGKNYADAPWFLEVVKRGYYVSDVFLGYRRIPHFVIAVTHTSPDGFWVLRATIDALFFNNLVKAVRIGSTGEAYILNRAGELQTEQRSGGRLMAAVPESTRCLAIPPSGLQTFIAAEPAGSEHLYAATWLEDKKWLLVARQEKADAFKDLRSAAHWILLISVAGGGVIVLAAFHSTNWIVSRMQRMDAEKTRLNQQLIGATRLAELGEMAAGFAHEINNPLQIINSEHSLTAMVLDDLKQSGRLQPGEAVDELEDSLAQIKLQVKRCAEITQSILKFGRQGEAEQRDIDLKQFIPEVVAMVRKKAAVHGIALDTAVDTAVLPVYGDPAQLQQVLLNLLNNAFHAVTQRHGADGGRLSIRGSLTDNRFVTIEVDDNGTGISPENLKKIFMPFFTTKPVGQGTGLGLSVCYGIIDKMGGDMQVSSELGRGTTFVIRLPSAAGWRGNAAG